MPNSGYFLGTMLRSISRWLSARLRTRNANNSSGCLACHADTLTHTDRGTLLCTSCGYEGAPEQGGDISYEEVRAFTGDEDRDRLF